MTTIEPRQDPVYWENRLQRSCILLSQLERAARQRPVAAGVAERLLLIAETARGQLWRLTSSGCPS